MTSTIKLLIFLSNIRLTKCIIKLLTYIMIKYYPIDMTKKIVVDAYLSVLKLVPDSLASGKMLEILDNVAFVMMIETLII